MMSIQNWHMTSQVTAPPPTPQSVRFCVVVVVVQMVGAGVVVVV